MYKLAQVFLYIFVLVQVLIVCYNIAIMGKGADIHPRPGNDGGT